MGLDIREVMCCVSKINPAVTYHNPFGLILTGKIKCVFDGDSGLIMNADGTYTLKNHYKSANKTNIKRIMNWGYKNFENSKKFDWMKLY